MPPDPATLAELVRDVAQRDGGKPALIFADQPISYAELDARIECAANGIAARGVARGDRVALLVPNIPRVHRRLLRRPAVRRNRRANQCAL